MAKLKCWHYYLLKLLPAPLRNAYFELTLLSKPKQKKRDIFTIYTTEKAVMEQLDKWVAKHGKKGYVPANFKSTEAEGWDNGIQQVRKEISEFVKVLLKEGLTKNILEIGLGDYGGTHTLWHYIFRDKIITIDKSPALVMNYKQREKPDDRSIFIVGKSEDPMTLKRVKKYVDEVDVLFIDGCHGYEGVDRDWDMYHNLVRPGGIIAFHDSVCRHPNCGIPKFLKDLSKGVIDGKGHILHNIVHSDDVGISYLKL